jgi:large subunit ribosomal protein L15
MRLNNLKPATGSTKKSKRIGRGEGSGRGGTSTRGHKGAKSRSGYKSKAGFEGGQMPLQRRVPKFGFKNKFRVEYKGVNLDTLDELAKKYSTDSINQAFLTEHGIVGKKERVKILGRGSEEYSAKLSIEAHAFSATAKEAIEKGGGTVTQVK